MKKIIGLLFCLLFFASCKETEYIYIGNVQTILYAYSDRRDAFNVILEDGRRVQGAVIDMVPSIITGDYLYELSSNSHTRYFKFSSVKLNLQGRPME